MIKEKPWGYVNVFAQTPFYQGKILIINKGEATSLQKHALRHTNIYLDEGLLLVYHNTDKQNLIIPMYPGEKRHFIPGDIYRLVALEDAKVIEVSTPQTGETTVIEDRYDRNESD